MQQRRSAMQKITVCGFFSGHRRTGQGDGLPQIFGNSDFFGQQEKFGQSQFLRKFPKFFVISKR